MHIFTASWVFVFPAQSFQTSTSVLRVQSVSFHTKGKEKRVGANTGRRPDWKKAIVTIDTNPAEVTYLGKGGKEVKTNKKYKNSIEEFMGA